MHDHDPRYSIGELAKLSGVSTKTIRFYSDSGVLPPTARSASGYRRYSNADRARLTLIRTLRELGLDLPTIADVLHNNLSVSAALTLQRAAVEVALRTLHRQRALLTAALRKDEATVVRYLDHARTVVNLEGAERETFLATHLERAFQGVPVNDTWKHRFWQDAVLDVPDELSDAQFDAWLELADLVADPAFLQRLNDIGRSYWSQLGDQVRTPVWTHHLEEVYRAAGRALQAGQAPTSAEGQQVVHTFLQLHAHAMSRVDDPTFPAFFLHLIEQGTDARAARYWELMAVLKAWDVQHAPATAPHAAAFAWLVEGLQWHVAQQR